MVEIISGEKGKGKTKYLLDKVNSDIKKVDGSIVYIDKNTKHMYELDYAGCRGAPCNCWDPCGTLGQN